MFLVDGYNVIRRTPALTAAEEQGSLAAGRRALVASVLASGILRSHAVTIVFDGGPGTSPSEPSPHPALRIRYSTPPEDADAAILSLLEGARDKTEVEAVTVVTADRELSFRAAGLGARVVAPDAWSGLTRSSRRAKSASRALHEASEKPRVTPQDVSYWLEVFGSTDEE
jgi:predicted RNA-binding protein with PIN domain